ncbi:Uncharacterized protein SAPIO_CDS4506 [Scedosporium apiospermum]|uniref:Cyclin-dependent kinase n=1 Tax=Pseudallescheria apiosperma TaxID=563466 RepID=A0A084G8B8_PSEDA|nr:Uncharacterized protein SAPIO_CDS4506 [Scedosporium apiospermum]KEZ43580.1 Uncharacterized protein SAPIO_CDS4506 [Scedosporium apiospermum]
MDNMHSQQSMNMSSTWQQQDSVADKVLKRAEVSKNRLALAQFKTKHGWEDLTLDTIEPKVEEERRRRRLIEGDVLSDSSSSTSDIYPSRTLMSSPLKAPGPMFSDSIGPSTGHRKRSYMGSLETIDDLSPSKRYRLSPSTHKSFPSGHATWKDMHQLAQSSPIKPRRQQHFTTQAGPNVSFLTSPALLLQSDDEDDMLPMHSFNVGPRSSPPRTPPMRSRPLNGRRSRERLNGNDLGGAAKTGEEGADLLLYLAASPSPAVGSRRNMEPPSTPPPKNNLALPSSMMVTPGGSGLFPNTPGQNFDFSDFVNITPSPAQKPWKTPVTLSSTRTPLSVARRRLTFDEPLV